MNDHIKTVESIIFITGDRKELDKFINENKDTSKSLELSFSKSVPLPQDLSKEEYTKWALSNWGTMGEVIETTEWEVYNQAASLEISTHWSPPTLYLFNVSTKYPELTFSLSQQPDTQHGWIDALYIRNGVPVDDFEDLHWEWVADTMAGDPDYPHNIPRDMYYETPAYMSGNPEEYERNVNRGGYFYNCGDCQDMYEDYLEQEFDEQEEVEPVATTKVSGSYTSLEPPF